MTMLYVFAIVFGGFCFVAGYFCGVDEPRSAAWKDLKRPARLSERPDIKRLIDWRP